MSDPDSAKCSRCGASLPADGRVIADVVRLRVSDRRMIDVEPQLHREFGAALTHVLERHGAGLGVCAATGATAAIRPETNVKLPTRRHIASPLCACGAIYLAPQRERYDITFGQVNLAVPLAPFAHPTSPRLAW